MHRLFYDDIYLGEVRYVDADFPSSFGVWQSAAFPGETDLHRHLRAYIAYSIESMRIMDATDAGPEWDELAGREEQKYQDLIDSELWWLVEDDGTRVPILIPIFRPEGEITWRYDPMRGRANI